MSVAFRRDSDEEHLEPRFELPIPPGPNLVTERSFALIEARAAELEQQLSRPMADEERKAVLRDARYWRSRLASAQLAPPADGETVAIGTRVVIRRGERTQTLDIVGHDESDPTHNRVSFASPLARALLGSAVGDEVDMPGADQPVVITALELIPA